MPIRLRPFGAIAVLIFLFAGCGVLGEPSADDTALAGEDADVPPVTAESTTTAPSPEPVTLAFGGDIHFEGGLRGRLAADPEAVLAPIAPVLAAADIAVVNLETAVTDRGTPAPKAYNFRTTPQAFDALSAAGVDVASMANNHGMDFGEVGLEDSLVAAERAGFPVIGIGRNAAQAYAPHVVEANGQRVAIVGATQVLDGSLVTAWTAGDAKPGVASAKEVERLVHAVESADAVADTVVVFLHWGREGNTCPTAAQQELADSLVDAGADVVVGGHAHRLQGGGLKGGALVHYGLGNFVFYKTSGPSTSSGVLRVTVDRGEVLGYEWVPARLRNMVATPLEGAEHDAALAMWDGLRDCTDLLP